MLWIAIQIIVAWYYGHLAEWLIHKYLLHEYGKKKSSIWSFHFHDHHSIVRRSGHVDPYYKTCKFGWDPKSKELLGLAFLALIHTPLIVIAPFFVLTIYFSIGQYYYVHRKSHVDIEWAKEKLPWHYDHHMGKNQNLNWGVRSDIFDRLFGTRKKYLKTDSVKE